MYNAVSQNREAQHNSNYVCVCNNYWNYWFCLLVRQLMAIHWLIILYVQCYMLGLLAVFHSWQVGYDDDWRSGNW